MDNDVYNVTVDINGLFYVYDKASTAFIVDVRRTQIIADDVVISDEGQNYTVLLLDEFKLIVFLFIFWPKYGEL